MAPRFKSLFGWSSSIPDSLPRGRSYDAPIASADSLPRPQPHAPLPARDAPAERPKTAPQKAATWDSSDDGGRTRSGFSMKSPPAFPAASRTRSRGGSVWTLRSPSDAPPPVPDVPDVSRLPPLPLSPAVRSFSASSLGSPAPSPQLPKDPSRPAPKPYVDILDAHSTIKAAKVRSRPLVVRGYGEDVADRNIASFGASAADKPYTTRARPTHIEILVKGDDGMNIGGITDQYDRPQDPPPASPRSTSFRSFTAPRPGMAYPPRSDSLRSDQTASASSASGDERVIPSIVIQDRRGHPRSPLASPATSVSEDSQVQVPAPRPAAASASPTRAAPPPPVPEPERRRSPSEATVRTMSQSTPVPPLPSAGTPSRQTSTSSGAPDTACLSDSPKRRARSRPEAGRSSTPTSVSSRDDAPPTINGTATHGATYSSSNISLSTGYGTTTPRTASPHSISTHTPSPSTASSTAAFRKRASSRSGSVSYSAFPSYTSRENRLSNASASSTRRRSGSRRRDCTESRGPSDIAPTVGRESSIETHVTTKVAPAVKHEEVVLTEHSIQHEVVTVETHTHEVHHRILPVVETEILPTKHYVRSEDGKPLVEIPESQIRNHAPRNSWHATPGTAPGWPEIAPVVGLARGEPGTLPRRNSTKSVKLATHTHEVRHRILPTKHYVPSEDGKSLVEMPKSQIPNHAPRNSWHATPGTAPGWPENYADPALPSPVETAAPPVVGLARGEPGIRPRRNSTKSVKLAKSIKPSKSTRSRAKSLIQPVLASKKGKMTEAGHPKTEYVWHHSPVVQTTDNPPRPIYVGAGLGDLTSHAYSSDEEEDLAGARFGAAVGEGGVLFKGSDYERSGSLPGLARQPDHDELYGTREPIRLRPR